MATAVNPLASSTSTPTPPKSSGLTAPSQQMFLQLLVAQIKNQDPLSPADPTQFTSQLAQFSELEQVIAIRGDIENAQSAASAAPPASTNKPANTTRVLEKLRTRRFTSCVPTISPTPTRALMMPKVSSRALSESRT